MIIYLLLLGSSSEEGSSSAAVVAEEGSSSGLPIRHVRARSSRIEVRVILFSFTIMTEYSINFISF